MTEETKATEIAETETKTEEVQTKAENATPLVDRTTLEIYRVSLMACEGSAAKAEANDRKIMVGIGLIANVLSNISSDQIKANIISRVIGEMMSVSGLQTSPAPAPVDDAKTVEEQPEVQA